MVKRAHRSSTEEGVGGSGKRGKPESLEDTPASVDLLVGMGYDEVQAHASIQAGRHTLTAALDWLAKNEKSTTKGMQGPSPSDTSNVLRQLTEFGVEEAAARRAVRQLGTRKGLKEEEVVAACLNFLAEEHGIKGSTSDVVDLASAEGADGQAVKSDTTYLSEHESDLVAQLIDMGYEAKRAREAVVHVASKQDCTTKHGGKAADEFLAACVEFLMGCADEVLFIGVKPSPVKGLPMLPVLVGESKASASSARMSLTGLQWSRVEELVSMGFDEESSSKAMIKLSRKRPEGVPPPSIEACIELLSRVAEGSDTLEDDMAMTGTEMVSTDMVRLSVVQALVGMGFRFEAATEASKRHTELEACVSWLVHGGEDEVKRQAAAWSSTLRGNRFVCPLEEEAMRLLELGVEVEDGEPLILRHLFKSGRELDLSDPLEIQYRFVESQIRRLSRSVTGRSSFEVEYVINPVLLQRFRKKHEEFKARYGEDSKESKIVLAFHGTHSQNVENIIKSNFDLGQIGKHTNNQGYYGKGIYLSEFPDYSRPYGDALFLCRVLPGKSFTMGAIEMGCGLKAGYGSHIYACDTEGRGSELVIFDVDQILPCYRVVWR